MVSWHALESGSPVADCLFFQVQYSGEHSNALGTMPSLLPGLVDLCGCQLVEIEPAIAECFRVHSAQCLQNLQNPHDTDSTGRLPEVATLKQNRLSIILMRFAISPFTKSATRRTFGEGNQS